MISIYWPRKKVPTWLQLVTPAGEGFKQGEIYHYGFGVIVRVKKDFIALGLSGAFIKIVGIESAIIKGAPFTGGNVSYTEDIKYFYQMIAEAKAGE